MARVFAFLRMIFIQVLVLAVLFILAETGARQFEAASKNISVELKLQIKPYMMFGAQSGGGFSFYNLITRTNVPSKISFNNYGFAENFDFNIAPDQQYLQKYGKKPGEKIVLITGGSVVYGVGATGNDKTIAAQTQRYLNLRSGGARYRVINMGMASWIAYQQFIGLSLFGLPFDPDWVISMDGHNDGVVACAHGCGVANPLGWPQMLNILQGEPVGSTQKKRMLLQTLAKESALVRVITGMTGVEKSKVPSNGDLIIDAIDQDPRFRIKMAGLTVGIQDSQIDFYLQAQRNVIALFHRANIILSTQPLMGGNAVSPAYRTAFSPKGTPADIADLEKELDSYMQAHRQDWCGSLIANEVRDYFMARSSIKLKDLVDAEQRLDTGRKLKYVNVEAAIPLEGRRRVSFFMDNAHLTDLGQERVGEFYAEIILSAERGEPFDYDAFIRNHGQ